MASRGRARGRGREASRGGPSVKKGTPKIPKDIEGLGTYFFSLDESNFQQYGSMFADMVVSYSSTRERLEEAVDLIYNTTTSNRDSAELGAKVCSEIINYEVKGASGSSSIPTEFRKCLLSHFQVDFKQKDVLRGHSVESWLGVFAFLCQIYRLIQINGQPISVMGNAICTSIDNTLQKPDIVDDEIDCICTHLKLCGELLEKNNGERFEALFTALRGLILKYDTSCMVRCVVLELIELKHMKWSDPDKTLDKFYVDALADAIAEDELRGTS